MSVMSSYTTVPMQMAPLTPTSTAASLRAPSPTELIANQQYLGQGQVVQAMRENLPTPRMSIPIGAPLEIRTQSPSLSFRTPSPLPSPLPLQTGVIVEQPSVLQAGVVGAGYMQAEISNLTRLYQEERAHRMRLEAEVAAMKARLDKLDPPESPFMAAVRQIERRGNIRVNHQTGHVQLVQQINFIPRSQRNDREPTAVFRDVAQAESICKDLAEISKLFCVTMTIEGHTKGGEGDYWQALADDRARLVAQKCIEFGANENLLQIQGRPGRQGKNEVRTEVYLDVQADSAVHDKIASAEAEERQPFARRSSTPTSPVVIRGRSNGNSRH